MESTSRSSFIKKIDQYLLRNHPVTWSTRVHTVGLYALGFAVVLAILSFIVPNDARNKSIIHYWIVLVSIISLLAFIFWMIYLLRFNVFKRYGTWKSTDTVKTFILYFIITCIMLSWPFIPSVIESTRANAKYSTEELATDINNMNIKICQLEQDSIDRRFSRDTFQVDNSVKTVLLRQDTSANYAETPVNEDYYLLDTTQLREKLEEADSVKKITNSIYVVYTCPNYRFVYGYLGWEYEDKNSDEAEMKLLSSMDLYRQVLQNKQVIDKENVRTELGRLFVKYDPVHDPVTLTTNTDIVDGYSESASLSRIRDRYDLYVINRKIDNITDKKYRWDETTIGISLRLIYYFGLCLAMLVLIYRHTTRRVFFLSLLAAVVLAILTGLFIAIAPNHDNSFFMWTIAYFILFAVLAALIFNSRYRTVISGIGLNLLVFMTPFMPLVITSYYYNSLRERYQYDYDKDWAKYYHLFENEKYHMFLSEIGGGLLLIILLATLYQMAYKKWYALPEQ